MAIQNRRGAYSDFDPTKLLPGEYAVVQSGDPGGTNGYAVYLCYTAGIVKRLVSADELQATIDNFTVSWSQISGKPEIDTTLSVAGAIPDSKVVGDILALKAPLASPAFTGTPTAPTPSSADNSLKVATTQFVRSVLTWDNVYEDGDITWTDIADRPKINAGSGADSVQESNGVADGQYSHAEGRGQATGYGAHAESYGSASGQYSHAEGMSNTVNGAYAHAEGANNTISSNAIAAHAEGGNNTVNGTYGHGEGRYNSALAAFSHAEGYHTRASRRSQHVFGEYNAYETTSAGAKGQYVEIVGNGDENTLSNARTLDWEGNETLAGTLTVGEDPSAPMEVATKNYVDTSIQSIEKTTYSDDGNGNITISVS